MTPPAEVLAGVDVRLRGVVHLYPSPEGDVVALRGVDLDVAAGSSVGLLGPSGAGKSTILALLAGSFVPAAGQVLIGGQDIGRMTGRALAELRAREVALVVQGAERNLLPYASVRDNVWFAQQGAAGRGRPPPLGPDDLLERFELTSIADRIVVGLPAGLQQQAALVAGVAPLPRLLLLDEPTSRLDPTGRDAVMATIGQICTGLGTTVVMVTHDPEVASSMARTLTIRDGRVGAEGRSGVEYAVVSPDGSVALPADALDILPPGSLVEILRHPTGIELRAAGEGT